MHLENLGTALSITGTGMLCVFIATGAIIVCVMLLNRLTKDKD